jgi:hypothetical protein
MNEDMSSASRSDTFTAGEGISIVVEKKVANAPERIWTFRGKQKPSALVINLTTIPSLFSPVTILTELLLINLLGSTG